MKGFILSAGFGKRMGTLTQRMPKPLIKVGGESLIEHNIQMLKSAGVQDIVINLGYMGQMIEDRLQDGARYGVKIEYTREDVDEGLLDSGGGVKNALHILKDAPFVLVSADIWTDYKLDHMLTRAKKHQNVLCVVGNPVWHADGDFYCSDEGKIQLNQKKNNVTFAGIGLFCPSFFMGIEKKRFGLIEAIRRSIDMDACFGVKIKGLWENVGTQRQKEALEDKLSIQQILP